MIQGAFSPPEVDRLIGWCFDDKRPEPVLLRLFVGDVLVREVRANQASPAMRGAPIGRNAGFSFGITDDLRVLLPRAGAWRVETECGHTLNAEPLGCDRLVLGCAPDEQTLRERLDAGWIVDKWGSLKLPFRSAPENKGKFLDLYVDCRRIFMVEFGLDLFIAYGTLLGYVRQGDLLDNDDDVDSSFCLSGSIEEVVDKQYNIASRLLEIRESYDIDLTISAPGQIVIWRGDSHIDIFTSWINTDGNFYSYFGVEGRLLKPKLQISQGKLLGRDIAAPEEAERILRMAYGPLWKTPDPTFQWVLSESLEKTMKLFKDAGERIFLERGLTA